MNTTLPTVNSISAAVLETLAKGQQIQENSIGGDRLTYFTKLASTTAEQDFKDAIRDYKKSHEKDKVASVRASEFQALYYATRNNIKLVEMGYQGAVVHARKRLAEIGLRINGSPVLSEVEKEANRNKTLLRKATNEAVKLIDMQALKSIDLTQPDAIIKLAEQQQIELAKLKAKKEEEILASKFTKVADLVKSVIDSGEEYALEVFLQLGTVLGYEMDSVVESKPTEELQQLAA
jgi:hypothetical protein